MSLFGVILVRIFTYSDWKRREIICPDSVRWQEKLDQNNSEYGHFSRSVNRQILHNISLGNQKGFKHM